MDIREVYYQAFHWTGQIFVLGGFLSSSFFRNRMRQRAKALGIEIDTTSRWEMWFLTKKELAKNQADQSKLDRDPEYQSYKDWVKKLWIVVVIGFAITIALDFFSPTSLSYLGF